MEITPEAKSQLKAAIQGENGNCIVASVKKSCCGEGLIFQIENRDLSQAILIEDIPFIMEGKANEMCESKRIAVRLGQLYIEDK